MKFISARFIARYYRRPGFLKALKTGQLLVNLAVAIALLRRAFPLLHFQLISSLFVFTFLAVFPPGVIFRGIPLLILFVMAVLVVITGRN